MPVDKNMTYNTIIQTIACALLEQDEIGWNNFVEGKFSRKWETAQELHYREDNT